MSKQYILGITICWVLERYRFNILNNLITSLYKLNFPLKTKKYHKEISFKSVDRASHSEL